jgi:hypothetical protein
MTGILFTGGVNGKIKTRANLPPVWNSSANLGQTQGGKPFVANLSATDPEGSDLSFYIYDSGTLPNGLSLSPTGILTGTPENIPGIYNFPLAVSDGETYATKTFTLEIQNTNPVWATLAGSLGTINENTVFSISLVATDENLDTLTFTVTAGSLPPGLTLASNGTISGTTGQVNQNTTYNFTVQVNDGVSGLSSRAFSITVNNNINEPPVWSTAAGSLGILNEQTDFSYGLSATDPDVGDTITYNISSGTLPIGLSLNTSTGVISGNTGVATGNVTYNFIISAHDGNNPVVYRSFSLTVLNNINEPPTWSTAAGNLGAFDTDSTINIGLLATDQNSDTITYSLVSGALPTGVSLSGNTISGSTGSVGTFNFTIRASDTNSGTTDRAFSFSTSNPVYLISNSLRTRSAGSTYLSRTPSVVGNRQKFTISAWVKRAALGTWQNILSSDDGATHTDTTYFALQFTTSNTLRVNGFTTTWRETSAVYRDIGAWYHVFLSVDTTTQTIVLAVNGATVSAFSTNNAITSNLQTAVNSGVQHRWGSINSYGYYLDGYLSDCHLIDGAQLTPTSFGKFDTNGVWVPIQYVGTGNLNNYTKQTPTGSVFGSMTGGGGLASGFDGTTSITNGGGPYMNGTSNGYFGKAFSSATSISRCIVYPPNDAGFGNTGGTCSLSIYGKNGTPSSGTDGTLLGSISFTDPNDNTEYARTIEFTAASYTHFWVYISQSGAGRVSSSELEYYSSTTSSYGTNGCHLEFKNAAALGTDTSTNASTIKMSVGGTAAASSQYSGAQASGAFDGTLISADGWLTDPAGTTTGWLSYTWTGATIVNQYVLYSVENTRAPGSWTFEGYNGSSWVVLDTQTSQACTSNVPRTYNFTNTTAYTSYRINVTAIAGGGNRVAITEMILNCVGGNNFAIVGFSASDQMVDSPTNNYCTLNPLDWAGRNTGDIAGYVISNGNLTCSGGTGGTGSYQGTYYLSSGKWYFSAKMTTVDGGGNHGYPCVGVISSNSSKSAAALGYNDIYGWGFFPGGYSIHNQTNGSVSPFSYVTGDTINIAFDATNGYLWVGKNGTWSGNPDDGTGYAFSGLTGGIAPSVTNYNTGVATFDFQSTAPANATSFKTLCTANLPAVAITKPKSYMNAVTYAGNNGNPQNITGLGFQPDTVWVKGRTNAFDHVLWDSMRGTGNVIYPNQNYAEAANAFIGTSLSDGFSVYNSTPTNNSGDNYVGWCWKKGATPGFDIHTFTKNNGAAEASFSHNLGAVPAMIIVKQRDDTSYWNVYHKSVGKDYRLRLESTAAQTNLASVWGTSGPSSTLFYLGPQFGATMSMVAYLWAEIPGFSKFGSYAGNGNADGTFVYTGFKPNWLLVKCISTGGSSTYNWWLVDGSRPGGNITYELQPNSSQVEGYSGLFDLTSNGFKCKNATYGNSAHTFIFAAFAEHPFGGSNVAPATAR